MSADRWAQGKRAHRELSDMAAATYDSAYASSNFATASYMNYELEMIDRALEFLHDHPKKLALDLGCGTGRDAFHFHEHFRQVRGFDFSTSMIAIAEDNKLHGRRSGNTHFILRDLEEDLLPDEPAKSVSFVNCAFGMGSFVENLPRLLREIRRVLEPGGVVVMSCYNREALVYELADTMAWEPSLAARLTSDGFLLVRPDASTAKEIACRPYTVKELRGLMESNFELLELVTFPTLSALFPQELFESEKARELCTVVDHVLSRNLEIGGGPYIVAIARRRGRLELVREQIGYRNVLQLFEDAGVEPNIRPHAPVTKTADVADALGVPLQSLVKSLLIRERHPAPGPGASDSTHYFAVAVPGNHRVDFAKVARHLRCRRDAVELVPAHEVADITGFSIGGIPPFGFPRFVKVLIDVRVGALDQVYCGTGKPTESLRISSTDLIRLASASLGDFAKPLEAS